MELWAYIYDFVILIASIERAHAYGFIVLCNSASNARTCRRAEPTSGAIASNYNEVILLSGGTAPYKMSP